MKKIILLLSLFVATSAQAFVSKGYNIEQLSQKSHVIFMGEVTKVEISPVNSAGLPYIHVYFKVYETFKGNVPAVYSFKQFAPKVGKQFQLLGMDREAYRPGEKMIMFLGAPSEDSGFSAPPDFQTFALQTKSSRSSDLDQAIVLNKQHGEKIGNKLFQNLQKPNSLKALEKLRKNSKTNNGVIFRDFRSLIQASVQS